MNLGSYWENNPGAETRARELWDSGLSTAAVARALGVSKGSICGLKHRRSWPKRPWACDTGPRKPRPSRSKAAIAARAAAGPVALPAGPITLPPLASSAILLPLFEAAKKKQPPKPKPVEAPTILRQSNLQCEWRFGDKPFRQCTNKAVFGYAYCEECCRRAYINWRGAAGDEVAA